MPHLGVESVWYEISESEEYITVFSETPPQNRPNRHEQVPTAQELADLNKLTVDHTEVTS